MVYCKCFNEALSMAMVHMKGTGRCSKDLYDRFDDDSNFDRFY